MDTTNKVATLLAQIGDAYRDAMDAAYDPALSPSVRHACVLAGMSRLGNARATLMALIDEEVALPLIKAAIQGEAPHGK